MNAIVSLHSMVYLVVIVSHSLLDCILLHSALLPNRALQVDIHRYR